MSLRPPLECKPSWCHSKKTPTEYSRAGTESSWSLMSSASRQSVPSHAPLCRSDHRCYTLPNGWALEVLGLVTEANHPALSETEWSTGFLLYCNNRLAECGMKNEGQSFLRRFRSEWAPMAWDLGAPVELSYDELPWFSPAPEPGLLPSPEQTAYSRLHDYVRRLEELSSAWKRKHLVGWPHDSRHIRNTPTLLLYPQGFVQVISSSDEFRSHPKCLSFYKVTDELVPHVRSILSDQNRFLSRPSSHRGPRFITHQNLLDAWHAAGEVSPVPQPTSAGLGWLVFCDGTFTEMLGQCATPTGIGLDVDRSLDPELPDSMASLVFELHSKGLRRFHKQGILGACLVNASGLILLLSAPEYLRSLAAILWLAGIYQFWRGRAGVRQGQLSRAVSCGLFRDQLAPSFVWSLVKRGASALLFLGIAFPATAIVHSMLLFSALASMGVLAAVETVAFWTETEPSWQEWNGSL